MLRGAGSRGRSTPGSSGLAAGLRAGHPYGSTAAIRTVGCCRRDHAAAASRPGRRDPAGPHPAGPPDRPDPRRDLPRRALRARLHAPRSSCSSPRSCRRSPPTSGSTWSPRRCSRRYPTAADYAAADRAELEEMIQSDRLLPGQDQLADRARSGPRRAVRRRGARRGSRTWSRCPASAARRPTSCSATPSASPASPSTRTSAGWPAGSAGPTETDPVKVEHEVGALFPRRDWTMLSHRLIFHGRRICHARKPACGACPVAAAVPVVRRGRDRPGQGREAGQVPGPGGDVGVTWRAARVGRPWPRCWPRAGAARCWLAGCTGATRPSRRTRRVRHRRGEPASAYVRAGLPALPGGDAASHGGLPDLRCPASAAARRCASSDLRGTPTVLNVWAAWCETAPRRCRCSRPACAGPATGCGSSASTTRRREKYGEQSAARLRRAVPVGARRGRRPGRPRRCGSPGRRRPSS